MSRAFEMRLLRIERILKEAALGTRYVVSDVLPRGRPGEDTGEEDPTPEGHSIHRRGYAVYVLANRQMTEEEWERERTTEF